MDPKNTNPPGSAGQNQGQKAQTPPPAKQGQGGAVQQGQQQGQGSYPPQGAYAPYPPTGYPPQGQMLPQGAYPPPYPPVYGDPYAQQGGYYPPASYPSQGGYPPAGYPPQGQMPPQGTPPGMYPPPYPPAGAPMGGMQGGYPPVPPAEDTTPANFQLGTKFPATLTVKAPKSELRYDAEYFIRLLAGSISLSKDEKKKIIESIPKLKQAQIDELIRIFEEEKQKFAALSKKHVPQLEKLAQQHFDEWMDLEHEWGQSQKKTEDTSKAEAIRKQLGI